MEERLLVEIHVHEPESSESVLSGVLWLEKGRIVVQGVSESTAEVRRRVPRRVWDVENREMVGPETGERFLWGVFDALNGPSVRAYVTHFLE